MIKKGDILIAAFVLGLCFFMFLSSFMPQDKLIAQIYLDGELTEEIDLSAVQTAYTETVGECEIEIDKNGIRFVSSTCPDKLCIKCGKLSKNSAAAACVPNKVVIALKGEKNTHDIIAY